MKRQQEKAPGQAPQTATRKCTQICKKRQHKCNTKRQHEKTIKGNIGCRKRPARRDIRTGSGRHSSLAPIHVHCATAFFLKVFRIQNLHSRGTISLLTHSRGPAPDCFMLLHFASFAVGHSLWAMSGCLPTCGGVGTVCRCSTVQSKGKVRRAGGSLQHQATRLNYLA